MKSAELVQVLEAIDTHKLDTTIHTAFANMVGDRFQAEQRQAAHERQQRQAVPQEVPDFHYVKPGTLVVRSAHWIDQNCRETTHDQIGMLTSLKLMEDDRSVPIDWPVVHWEGDDFAVMNHPLNVALRNGKKLPTKIMTTNTPTPRQVANTPTPRQVATLSNGALRKMLPPGALFTSVYTGSDPAILAPHGVPLTRLVTRHSNRDMTASYLSGHAGVLGRETTLTWDYCRNEIVGDGAICLFWDRHGIEELFLTISEIVLPKSAE